MTDPGGSTPSVKDTTSGDHHSPPPDGAPPGYTEDGTNVEPVELLVQLAEEGEIDPWDIDIVDATDAFLSRLDNADLRSSGRALFYAAVLLRMKSDALLQPAEEESTEEERAPWEAALDNGGIAGDTPPAESGFDPVDALEAEMDRRLERKHARGSAETLDELVRELREAERQNWWKRHREYDTSGSPEGYQRGTQTLDYRATDEFRETAEPRAAEVTKTTHGEDIEASIDRVHDVLEQHFTKGRHEVLFAEIAQITETRVTSYLSVLFLSHRSAVCLQQDSLFGDLWIQRPDNHHSANSESESEGVESGQTKND